MSRGLQTAYDVQSPSDGAGKDKRPRRQHLAASETVDSNGHTVGKVEHHHGSRDNGVESTIECQCCNQDQSRGTDLLEPRKIQPKMMTRPKLR